MTLTQLLLIGALSLSSATAFSYYPEFKLISQLKNDHSESRYSLHLTGRNLDNGRACYLHVDSEDRIIQFSSDKTNMSIRTVLFATSRGKDIQINEPNHLKLFVSYVTPAIFGNAQTADLTLTNNKLQIRQVSREKVKLNCEYDLAYNKTLPQVSKDCKDASKESKEASCRFQSNLVSSNIEILSAEFDLMHVQEQRCVRGEKVKFFTGYRISGPNGADYSQNYKQSSSDRPVSYHWLGSKASSEIARKNNANVFTHDYMTYNRSANTVDYKHVSPRYHMFKPDDITHIRATCSKN